MAAVTLAVVTWLSQDIWEREKPQPLPLVLQELVRSGKAEQADASSWDSPAAQFERLLGGNPPDFDLSQPNASSDLQKRFLRNIAQAVLEVECFPTSHWNSAVAFGGGVPFALPPAHHHGYERLMRLMKGALRVLGQDGVRSFGPVLFARQLGFTTEDLVYSPIADCAADVLEAASYPDRLRFPDEAIKLGAEQWYPALRRWWLEKAKANGWEEELSVVQRMMEERGIRPDGTGARLVPRDR